MTSYSSSASSSVSSSESKSSSGKIGNNSLPNGLGPNYPPMGVPIDASPDLQQQRERYRLVLGGARKTRKNKKVIKKNVSRKHKN